MIKKSNDHEKFLVLANSLFSGGRIYTMIQRELSSAIAILVVSAVLIFFSLTVAGAASQPVKIATINMQKVVRNSAAGKKAMKELNEKFEALQKKLRAKQEEIKAFKEDLEKKAPLMSEEARADKEREYKKMLRDFKDKSDDAQYEMRQAESKRMEPILKELEKLVNQIGRDGKYTIILEHNMPGLYYISPDIDITDMVIKKYDNQTGAKTK